MPATVTPIRGAAAPKRATWSLLEIAPPGRAPEPWGILFADEATDQLTLRLRDDVSADEDVLEEQAQDVLLALEQDLQSRAGEMGASKLLASLEDSLSGFFRIGDRTAITYAGAPQATADNLFDEFVDSEVHPFVTHLPLYTLRAAAGRFGEEMSGEQEAWVRTRGLRLTDDMFVAHVVGRSMEPLIPDGSLCVFRSNVAGSRQGKRVLVEEFGIADDAGRYTVKRYTSRKAVNPEGDWSHEQIRLEPLNPEYEAFDLSGDEFGSRFRVLAEFVAVLHS